MSVALRAVALGFAVAEAQRGVYEEGANTGPRVSDYLKNTDPPINSAAPWCAAAVQFWTDCAARALKVPNPLDAVKLEAYVPSYYNWAGENGKVIDPSLAEPGDLVIYNFGGKRWDHMGMMLSKIDADGWFSTIEGNTSPPGGGGSQHDGDGVYQKKRRHDSRPMAFVRWAP